MSMTPETKKRLLKKVADADFGGDVDNMLEANSIDSVVYGICINPDCETISDSCEPDASENHCEECEGQTVQSVLILAELI